MKTILGALALTLAFPALAQAAPSADHSAHQGMDHGQRKDGKHDCKECCEKMKQQGGKMECMDKKAESKTPPAGQQDHQANGGHAH